MSRPVFSFRPTLDDSEHKRAWEILQSVPNGQKNAFLVQAILQSADSENLIEKIRMVFREELKGDISGKKYGETGRWDSVTNAGFSFRHGRKLGMSGKADTMGFESPLDFSGKRAKEVVLF